jgi:hypothetical protein
VDVYPETTPYPELTPYSQLPPVPRPRRSRGRIIAIVVGVALAACCAGGTAAAIVGGALSGKDGPDGTVGASMPPAAPERPGLNTPVRDGKFEFVVLSFSCGHTSVGAEWWTDQPQGQFCVAEMRVSNISTEPQRFADGVQKAIGPEGNVYAADTGAGVVANGNGEAVWNVVNPGNALTVKVVWDIPTTASVATLELHDSGFSGGVTVRVALASA